MVLKTTFNAELLEIVNSYLQGRRSGHEVSEWAVAVIANGRDVHQDELSKWTLDALMCLGHDDPQWDTPVEDLEFLRDCLLGKEEFKLGPVARKNV